MIPCCQLQIQKPVFSTTGGRLRKADATKPWATKKQNASAAWSRRDGGQLRRQREADIFTNQIEIALIRETVFGEALADLLNQNFGSGSTGGEADAPYAFEPLRINIHGGIDQCGFDAVTLGNFDETIRIGRILRADNENEVDVFRNLFDGILTILRGVADVVAFWAYNLGKLLAEASDD